MALVTKLKPVLDKLMSLVKLDRVDAPELALVISDSDDDY